MDYVAVSTIPSKSEVHPSEIKHSQYSPVTCGHGYFGYGLSMSIMFTLYMFFFAGTHVTFAKFYFSYLKFDKFGISTNDASWGIILFWLSFSVNIFCFLLLLLFIYIFRLVV